MVKSTEKNKRIRNICNGLMLCLAQLVLLAGLARTLVKPKDTNLYENRPANQVVAPTLASWLDGTFQDSVEAALSDQVLLAQTMKKTYNDIENQIRYEAMMRISSRHPDIPVQYGKFYVYGGKYLAYQPTALESLTEALDRRVENCNRLIAAHPDVSFYLYYIERDSDNFFDTGEKTGAYEYLTSRVKLPKDRMKKFAVDDLETFERDFYQTDHHWSYQGSYRGYREAASMFGVTDPVEPEGRVSLTDHFAGSKSRSLGAQGLFFEPMDIYRFSFPSMAIQICGQSVEDYGQQTAAAEGRVTSFSYGEIYGQDDGEIIFDSGTTGRGNLLMLGESYDNAILKLMASHFDRVYSVDLRSYEKDMGKPFRLADYLDEHRITKVLWVGCMNYFSVDDFLLED